MKNVIAAKLDPAIQPVVTVLWSESKGLYEGEILSLNQADSLFRSLDTAFHGSGYEKTKFNIAFTFHGEEQSYEGRQDFGDGDGGLIDHIQAFNDYYLKSEKWHKQVLRHDGPKALRKEMAERVLMVNEFVPYLRLHSSLTEFEQTTVTELAKLSRLLSPDALDQSRIAYYQAILTYISECRNILNTYPDGHYTFPPIPKEQDYYTSELKAYQEQVKREVSEEAKEAGLTVEEYLKLDFPPSPQPVKASSTKRSRRCPPTR